MRRSAILLTIGLLGLGGLLWLWLARGREPPPVPLAASYPEAFYAVPASSHDGPDLLLVSVDTLRPDHLSLYGYDRPTSPELDRFFADAAVYENAYSAEANTAPSVVTMLTGLYPNRHRVRLLYQRIGPEVVTLSDRLRQAGYQTAAVVSNMVLTAEASGLSTRFDHYDDFLDERERKRSVFERRAASTTDAAIDWLRRGRDGDRPHFLWVHYIDPHGPYNPPADAPADFRHDEPVPIDLERVAGYQRFPGVSDGAEYLDRYDEEIAYADREIGRLLREYERLGLWQEAVAVFTADHGETMIEQDRHFSHGYHVWEPIMRVPLMVRRPGGAPSRPRHPVSLVDLAPTLLAEIGLAVPLGLDGRPLDDDRPGRPISLEASFKSVQQRAVLLGRGKWFATIDNQGQVKERWYTELDADPGESERRPWSAGLAAEELDRWIASDPDPGGRPLEYLAGAKLGAPKLAAENVPESDLERLRALGYID